MRKISKLMLISILYMLFISQVSAENVACNVTDTSAYSTCQDITVKDLNNMLLFTVK